MAGTHPPLRTRGIESTISPYYETSPISSVGGGDEWYHKEELKEKEQKKGPTHLVNDDSMGTVPVPWRETSRDRKVTDDGVLLRRSER